MPPRLRLPSGRPGGRSLRLFDCDTTAAGGGREAELLLLMLLLCHRRFLETVERLAELHLPAQQQTCPDSNMHASPLVAQALGESEQAMRGELGGLAAQGLRTCRRAAAPEGRRHMHPPGAGAAEF